MSEKIIYEIESENESEPRNYKKYALGYVALLLTVILFIHYHTSCQNQVSLPDNLNIDLHSLVNNHLSSDQVDMLSHIINIKQENTEEHQDKRDDDNSDDKKKNNLLNQAWVRFLMAVAGIILLNMIAIIVQHIYTKLTFSAKSYRNVEHDISPF